MTFHNTAGRDKWGETLKWQERLLTSHGNELNSDLSNHDTTSNPSLKELRMDLFDRSTDWLNDWDSNGNPGMAGGNWREPFEGLLGWQYEVQLDRLYAAGYNWRIRETNTYWGFGAYYFPGGSSGDARDPLSVPGGVPYLPGRGFSQHTTGAYGSIGGGHGFGHEVPGDDIWVDDDSLGIYVQFGISF